LETKRKRGPKKMGKKFTGENTKVAAAKERKAAVENEKKAKKEQEEERKMTEEWSVGAKKGSKKDLEEEKKAERAAKKAEREALEARENAELDKMKKVKPPPALRGEEKKVAKLEEKNEEISRERSVEVYEARGIDAALDLMTLATSSSSTGLAAGSVSSSDALERHPERRMKAAYTQYEERELPIIKAENPTLRFTQLKEIVWKNWQKSPENPMNQQHIDYNVSNQDEKKIIVDQKQTRLDSYKVSDSD